MESQSVPRLEGWDIAAQFCSAVWPSRPRLQAAEDGNFLNSWKRCIDTILNWTELNCKREGVSRCSHAFLTLFLVSFVCVACFYLFIYFWWTNDAYANCSLYFQTVLCTFETVLCTFRLFSVFLDCTVPCTFKLFSERSDCTVLCTFGLFPVLLDCSLYIQNVLFSVLSNCSMYFQTVLLCWDCTVLCMFRLFPILSNCSLYLQTVLFSVHLDCSLYF